MSIRDAFADRFGEDQAAAIEAAAKSHGNGVNDQNLGTDPFKWALLICIGYQCMELYREGHGITAPWADIREWIVANADLRTHDGDCDYLALMGGTYNEYIRDGAA